ncbi:MAG: anti-sigma factor [Alphaproteobacteria bacterium]
MTDNDLNDMEALAAEYALGVLDGANRRRAQQLQRRNPAFDAMVQAWERRLAPMSDAVSPVQPPADLWNQLERDLGPVPVQRATPPTMAVPTESPALLKKLAFWRRMTFVTSGLAGAAVAAAMMLAVVNQFETQGLAERYVAVLNSDAAEPALVVTIDPATQQMTIRPVRTDTEGDQTLQLWLVADETPHSLGLLDPVARTSLAVSPEVERALRDGVLAVSLEPPGGSPTGLPTGPVVYHGQVLPLDE